ncbi:MAG: hypothetical protein P8100_11860, partial [bacterium]
MKRTVFLEHISPWSKLLILSGLLIVSAIFTSLLGLLLGKVYFGTDLQTLSEYLANPTSEPQILFMKFYQLINQFGVFFIPVLLFAFLVSPSA